MNLKNGQNTEDKTKRTITNRVLKIVEDNQPNRVTAADQNKHADTS